MRAINRRRKQRGAATFFSFLGDLAEARMPISTVAALAVSIIAAGIILAYSWGIR